MENTRTNQKSMLERLQAIPKDKQVHFVLRDTAGKEFVHTSAIDRTRECCATGIDTGDNTVALSTPIPHVDSWLCDWWVAFGGPRPSMCHIIDIQDALPDIATLQKWADDGVQVRITYWPAEGAGLTGAIGTSPIVCRLLAAPYSGEVIRVSRCDGEGSWNMFLNVKAGIGLCRPLVTSITPIKAVAQTEQEMLAMLQQAEREGTRVEATMCDGSKLLCEEKPPIIDVPMPTTVNVTCCADVAPYIGRKVRVEDGIVGLLTGCGVQDGRSWFGLNEGTPGDDPFDDVYWYVAGDDDVWIFTLVDADEPPQASERVELAIVPTYAADLEPYIGRRVRVLAGSEREVVREGTLTHAYRLSDGFVLVTSCNSAPWGFGPGRPQTTLVEVLAESLEVDSEAPAAVAFCPSDPAREPSAVESKLTLCKLLAMAPSASEVRAYEAFQETVRAAIDCGLVTA